jgi:transposase-like protein
VVATEKNKIGYAEYRFPPEIIHQAIWLYLRFSLSLRDVDILLAKHGITIAYWTIQLGEPFRARDRHGRAQTPAQAPHNLVSR